MSDIDLLPADQIEVAQQGRRREVMVQVHLAAPAPGQLGPMLDELVPLLREAAEVLRRGGVQAEIDIPGYHQAFYGWESDEDDPS